MTAAHNSGDRARLVLHLGLPKTGTTTLQVHLFRNHSGVHYLGKHIDGKRRIFRRMPIHAPEIDRVVRLIRKADEDAAQSAEARGVIAAEVAQAHATGRVPVLSNEGFTAIGPLRHAATARCIRHIAPDCRVMIVLRNPVDLVRSLYIQKLLNPGSRRRPDPKGTQWRDFAGWIDEHLSRRGGGALSNLTYAGLIRHLVDELGRESIGVFLLEQLREDAEAYYRSMLEFIGIDVDEGLGLVMRKRENTRLTQAKLELFRKYCESPITGPILRKGPLVMRRMIMWPVRTPDPNDTSGRAQVEVPPDHAARIAEDSREGNRWLAQEFDLPLEHYGYAL